MAEEPEDRCLIPAEVPVLPGNAENRFGPVKDGAFRHCIDRHGNPVKKSDDIGKPAEDRPRVRQGRGGHFHNNVRVEVVVFQCFFRPDKIDIRAFAVFYRLVTDGKKGPHSRKYGLSPHLRLLQNRTSEKLR